MAVIRPDTLTRESRILREYNREYLRLFKRLNGMREAVPVVCTILTFKKRNQTHEAERNADM